MTTDFPGTPSFGGITTTEPEPPVDDAPVAPPEPDAPAADEPDAADAGAGRPEPARALDASAELVDVIDEDALDVDPEAEVEPEAARVSRARSTGPATGTSCTRTPATRTR